MRIGEIGIQRQTLPVAGAIRDEARIVVGPAPVGVEEERGHLGRRGGGGAHGEGRLDRIPESANLLRKEAGAVRGNHARRATAVGGLAQRAAGQRRFKERLRSYSAARAKLRRNGVEGLRKRLPAVLHEEWHLVQIDRRVELRRSAAYVANLEHRTAAHFTLHREIPGVIRRGFIAGTDVIGFRREGLIGASYAAVTRN